jgi:hypothetical protein
MTLLIHSQHTSKLHDPNNHHHSTPNHCCERLLMGWKQGVTTIGMMTKQSKHNNENDNDNDNNDDNNDAPLHST